MLGLEVVINFVALPGHKSMFLLFTCKFIYVHTLKDVVCII